MISREQFDVIVIGGGHAGTEAALTSARMGASTLLITHSIETIGQMSCNPAIGGIGKSHLVREIDALDGVMAHATDEAGIHFRTLNASKGPAVQALRAQADRNLYKQAIRRFIENQPNLKVFQDTVSDLDVQQNVFKSVTTRMGITIRARTAVLTTGTFLGGRLYMGHSHQEGGRAGDAPSNALARTLRNLPFRVSRLKTGTPPRIDGKSVDFSQLEVQPGDEQLPVMSFMGETNSHPRQVPCYITYTNPKTHKIIRSGLKDSPLYSGKIEGVGPRYCPSIEDKVVRFADRDSHQIFVEPEGLDVNELYPNGISTSLSFEIQNQAVRSIKGFENAHITRPGYAIEYDFFDPRDLHPTLETRLVEGLFFAGQINGTTGYEEAAAQGLLAGINAVHRSTGKSGWYPRRHEAYLGVLVDDLTTLGTDEPYRMFTSRAEYRLRLRQDNADTRLTTTGHELGVVGPTRWKSFQNTRREMDACKRILEETRVQPDDARLEALSRESGETLRRETKLGDLIRRPAITISVLQKSGWLNEMSTQIAERVAIEIKYQGYVERQDREIEISRSSEKILIPDSLDYETVQGLSNELKQKLQDARPPSLATASRIPGITPAALSLIAVHAKREKGPQTHV